MVYSALKGRLQRHFTPKNSANLGLGKDKFKDGKAPY